MIISPGNLVFDIGANLGQKTDSFLSKGARVICVEPQPTIIKHLKEKYSNNQDVVIVPKGVAERAGSLTMSLCKSSPTISTFADHWKRGRFLNSTWDEQVETLTLDDLIDQFGLPDYCKIDVEGFELQVLRGLSRTLPLLSFEFVIEFIESAKQCVAYLELLGFQQFNYCIGENNNFVLTDWVTCDELINIISNNKDPLLWGDIYAACDTPNSKKPSKSNIQILTSCLVDPKTHEALQYLNGELRSVSGTRYSIINNVPVFVPTTLTEPQKSELQWTHNAIDNIFRGEHVHYSIDKPYESPKICWEWTECFIDKNILADDTKIICIGGSFVDDLPHIESKYKFNIDHLAHEYVKRMPQILKANTNYISAISESMPFPDGFADIIYTRNSLDHVCNPAETLSEIYRVLKPDGKLFIGAYYNSTFINEHESTVIDNDFIAKCIEPLFYIEHKQIIPTTQKASFGDNYTDFIHMVCTKLKSKRDFLSKYEVDTIGEILYHFQRALYYQKKGETTLAKSHYLSLLNKQPILETDNWRQLYGLINYHAISDKTSFFTIARLLSTVQLKDMHWKKIVTDLLNIYFPEVSCDELQKLQIPDIAVVSLAIDNIISINRVFTLIKLAQTKYCSGTGQHFTDLKYQRADTDMVSSASSTVNELKRRCLLGQQKPLKLHLGCGKQYFEGYINIDYPAEQREIEGVKADLYADITTLSYPKESVDEIRLHHVFEHFNRVVALAQLIRWHEWLKPGGKLHIETPDIEGSARILLSDMPWKVKSATIRHLAGDQASQWAYHVDHWCPERFERTLRKLGFVNIEVNATRWPHEPYLANVTVTAFKQRTHDCSTLLNAAHEILRESAVSDSESSLVNVWQQQLSGYLDAGTFTKNATTVLPEIQVPSYLSKLPLEEIHLFNQKTRDRWVAQKASTVPPNSRVLDVGAGTCPYRSLFAHCEYKAHDFKKYSEQKQRDGSAGYGNIDYESDITSIPVPDASFDIVLCTEVLEHVPDPPMALKEIARILRPGGQAFLTVPLGSGLHQLPYHYYGGLSPSWYHYWGNKFGLSVVEITPNGGFFRLLAQECVRAASLLQQSSLMPKVDKDQLKPFLSEKLPRILFALEDETFIDQFTVGYHVVLHKPTVSMTNPSDSLNGIASERYHQLMALKQGFSQVKDEGSLT